MRNFDNKAQTFSKTNMEYLAYCAGLAYKGPAGIHNGLAKLGFTTIEKGFYFSSDGTDTHGFIVGDAEKIILAFCGTEADKTLDWLTDAHIVKTDFMPGDKKIGAVHRGFHDALLSVWPSIEVRLKKLRDNHQNLWITGHSLGGALAMLASATLAFHDRRPLAARGLYTFGQPRVGDGDFAGAYNIAIGHRSFRMVNNQDIVSSVPPILLGFRHCGTLKYFDAAGRLIEDGAAPHEIDETPEQTQKLSNTGFSAITDHSMDKYHTLAAAQAGNSMFV